MSTDPLRSSLHEIALGAARVLPPVPLATVRRRLRRRRAARRATGVAATLVLVTALGAGAMALDVLPGPVAPAGPTPSASPSPSPTVSPSPTPSPTATDPVPGWTADTTVCGTTPSTEQQDSTVVEVQGRVAAGVLDPQTAGFHEDPAGPTLYLGVSTTADSPGLPAGDGISRLRVVLLDATGTVVLWNDPARQLPQIEATDGSGMSSIYGLYDAVDCRTGQPLDGTYRVLASDADEVIELAPVALGSAVADDPRTDPAEVRAAAPQPTCGQPLDAATRALLDDPDVRVELPAGSTLGSVRGAGVHRAVDLVSEQVLTGEAPVTLRAFLVDAGGVVVTSTDGQGLEPWGTVAQQVTTGAGPAAGAELFQWFGPCREFGAVLEPGDYDLYVLDAMDAADADGVHAPRTLAGGPFPVTLTSTW